MVLAIFFMASFEFTKYSPFLVWHAKLYHTICCSLKNLPTHYLSSFSTQKMTKVSYNVSAPHIRTAHNDSNEFNDVIQVS